MTKNKNWIAKAKNRFMTKRKPQVEQNATTPRFAKKIKKIHQKQPCRKSKLKDHRKSRKSLASPVPLSESGETILVSHQRAGRDVEGAPTLTLKSAGRVVEGATTL